MNSTTNSGGKHPMEGINDTSNSTSSGEVLANLSLQ